MIEHKAITYLLIVLKNSVYPAIVFLFTPLYVYLAEVVPNWKELILSFKDIASLIVVLLVIYKLVLEIIKLKKK